MRPRRAALLLSHGALAGWGVIVGFPLYWILIGAFKGTRDVATPHYLPGIDFRPQLGQWLGLLARRDLVVPALVDSLIISLASSIFVVVLGTMAAYGLARFDYRFLGLRTTQITVAMFMPRLLPPAVLVFPIAFLYARFGLLDTHLGLIAVYTVLNLPLAIWILRDFVRAVPLELEQSAQVEGCSRSQAFWRVVFPLVLPGVVIAFVIAFIFAWNEHLFALVLSYGRVTTVPLRLAAFGFPAFLIVSLLPAFIAALVLDRYLARAWLRHSPGR